jgi:Fic family protein
MAPWNKDKPYNLLPDLPPKGFVVDEELAASLIAARVALARADQAAKQMPNPDVLLVGIAISEAQASSEIENIVTTRDALYESIARGDKTQDAATYLALEYRRALEAGFAESSRRPIGYPLIARLAATVLGYKVNLRSTPGTFIGGPKSQVLYTPPEGPELLSRKLDALLDFVSSTKLDPLITVCLAHYQFEAIHPFPDGNGRVGRLLNVLWLSQLGIIEKPIVAPSMVINAARPEYYKVLEEATSKGAYKQFVLFLLSTFEQAAVRSVSQSEQLIEAQRSLAETTSRVFSQGVGWELAGLLFLQPYARISHLVDALRISRPTAAKYLEELESLGFLQSVVRGRDKYFVNRRMLGILDWKKGK